MHPKKTGYVYSLTGNPLISFGMIIVSFCLPCSDKLYIVRFSPGTSKKQVKSPLSNNLSSGKLTAGSTVHPFNKNMEHIITPNATMSHLFLISIPSLHCIAFPFAHSIALHISFVNRLITAVQKRHKIRTRVRLLPHPRFKLYKNETIIATETKIKSPVYLKNLKRQNKTSKYRSYELYESPFLHAHQNSPLSAGYNFVK